MARAMEALGLFQPGALTCLHAPLLTCRWRIGRRAVAEAYVVGLQWVLHYYYDGVVSWSWFYPYHYPPMISDLVRLDQVKIAFEPGAPP